MFVYVSAAQTSAGQAGPKFKTEAPIPAKLHVLPLAERNHRKSKL